LFFKICLSLNIVWITGDDAFKLRINYRQTY